MWRWIILRKNGRKRIFLPVETLTFSDVSAAHRRRSNTAQRLEKLKREKHKQSKIRHVQWKDVQHPVDQIGAEYQLFWLRLFHWYVESKEISLWFTRLNVHFEPMITFHISGELFEKQDVPQRSENKKNVKSLLAQQLEDFAASPNSAFIQYAKFDGKVGCFVFAPMY